VKSVSNSLATPSLPAQEQELALLFPQAQVSPLGLAFSLDEREHVQAPASRWSDNGMLALLPWLKPTLSEYSYCMSTLRLKSCSR